MSSSTHFRLRAAVRRANRLRWRAKARNLQQATGRRSPANRHEWGYVLWDPEIGDFSYDLDDLDAAAELLATSIGADVAAARHYLEEPMHDVRLLADYADRRRRTVLRRQMSIGQRAVWWAIIRLRRPALVVETGAWYGLGSLVILRALEANASDGTPEAQLISFDIDPTAGWLVPDRFRAQWTLIHGATEDELRTRLAGRRVDLFIHDTPSDYTLERGEFQVALAHAASGAILLSGNGTNTDALSDLAAEHSLAYQHLPLSAKGHWYENPGASLVVARDTSPQDS